MNPHTGIVVNAKVNSKPPLDWPYCTSHRAVDSTAVVGESAIHYGNIEAQITVTHLSISTALPFDLIGPTIPSCLTELQGAQNYSVNSRRRLAKCHEIGSELASSQNTNLAPSKRLSRSLSQRELSWRKRRWLGALKGRGRASSDSGRLTETDNSANQSAFDPNMRVSNTKSVASWETVKNSLIAAAVTIPTIMVLKPPEDLEESEKGSRAESITSEQARALEPEVENDEALGCRMGNLRLTEREIGTEMDTGSITGPESSPEMDIDDRPCEPFPEVEHLEEDNFSDDPYWEWDVNKQQFKHLDSDTEEWVYCPAEFD